MFISSSVSSYSFRFLRGFLLNRISILISSRTFLQNTFVIELLFFIITSIPLTHPPFSFSSICSKNQITNSTLHPLNCTWNSVPPSISYKTLPYSLSPQPRSLPLVSTTYQNTLSTHPSPFMIVWIVSSYAHKHFSTKLSQMGMYTKGIDESSL